MIILKILILFEFILISKKALGVRVHTEFGDYNRGIHKDSWMLDCGLTRVPKKRENVNSIDCFKWKTPFRELMSLNEKLKADENKYNLNKRIMNGEIASEGEAPWAAYIEKRVVNERFNEVTAACGGVILNKKWILTAAHCIVEKIGYTFTVYVGNHNRSKATKFKVSKVWRFNAYEYDDSCYNDVGLIKIDGQMGFIAQDGKYLLNSICLPKMGLVNGQPERATMYGWGATSNTSEYLVQPDLLRKGNFHLEPFHHKECHGCYCAVHETNPNYSGPYGCTTDSGSGLIQFIGPNKRGVVIGVYRGGKRNEGRCAFIASAWVPISTHIDWILHMMRNN